MAEWQPIETAPESTAILIYISPAGPIEVGHYNTALRSWVSCWDHRNLENKWGTATHWIPLPEPPTT